MKNLVMIIILLVTQISNSQGLLQKVKGTVKQTSEEVILNKTSDKVTQTLDSAFSKKLTKKKSNEKENEDKEEFQPDSKKSSFLKQYSKFDFTPGETLVYYRDFSEDRMGELPIGWNTNGSGEVVTFDNLSGTWLKLMQSSTFLSDNKEVFDENFTLEFDLLFNSLHNNIINYPAFYFGFLASGEKTTNHNSLLGFPEEDFLAKIYLGLIKDGNGNSIAQLESFENGNEYFKTDLKSFSKLENITSVPIHIAVQVQKERFRLWVNEDKIFDLPKAISLNHHINQLYYQVGDVGLSDEEVGIFISNIEVANGVPDLRKNLFEKGTFTTSAIHFDSNKATIKAESYGILNEIGKLLKENSTFKIEIVGHTDSVGDDNENLTLSERRAKSISNFLNYEFKIDKGRMNTSGKGEKFPIADNETTEGRAKNRRVEFIKI